jgi:hypothetical protein
MIIHACPDRCDEGRIPIDRRGKRVRKGVEPHAWLICTTCDGEGVVEVTASGAIAPTGWGETVEALEAGYAR